jgi:phospholipid transport system substrate-binding protein
MLVERYGSPMFNALRSRLVRLSILIILLVLGSGDLGAQEVRPSAVVATFQDTLLSTMKEAKALGFKGRYRRLLPAMELAFDLEQMTRIVVGGRWAEMNTVEQKQVVDLFRQFSVSTYASAFSSYGGEQFEVGDELPHPGIGTIVETRLVLKADPPIELNYLLRETSAGWKIMDVYLGGAVSELARRRGEFASIINNQGLTGLIALLKKKNKELAGG